MRNAFIFRAVLQVINSAPVLIDVSTVRMPFENHVDVAAEHAVVFVVTIAVVPAVNNDVRAFAPKLLGLGFHQIRQTASSYEINVFDLTCGYRGIAISYCADNADFDSAALHRNRRLTIIRYFARASLSDVDGQKRKIGNCQIVRNLFFAPVELVIAQGHRNEVQFVHPFRHHVAFGEVGFAASLPHISRREHHGIAVCGIALKVSRELVHAGLIRRIEDFPVQIVDGEKIKVNGNHQIAVVAATVLVYIFVKARFILSARGQRQNHRQHHNYSEKRRNSFSVHISSCQNHKWFSAHFSFTLYTHPSALSISHILFAEVFWLHQKSAVHTALLTLLIVILT